MVSTDTCLDVVTAISKNSFLSPFNTLPGLNISRQDSILDSGIVLFCYGIRKGTDVDVILLNVMEFNIKHMLLHQASSEIHDHGARII